MTYKVFKIELSIKFGLRVPEAKKKSGPEQYEDGGIQLYINDEPALILAWETGGVTGGSCWSEGDTHHSYSTGNPEPEWEELTGILEHFCPQITFLQYKKLMRLAQTDTCSRDEYYGNSRNFALRILKLQDLWQYLNDNNLLERNFK